MTRTPLMAGNWKMNLDHLEANHLVQGLAMELSDHNFDYSRCEVLVIPPFTDLRTVQTVVDADDLQIKYGAQDISVHDNGAFTGEISSEMRPLRFVRLEPMSSSFSVRFVQHSKALPPTRLRRL